MPTAVMLWMMPMSRARGAWSEAMAQIGAVRPRAMAMIQVMNRCARDMIRDDSSGELLG